MEDLKNAIYHELFLNLYDNWKIGYYYSSRGLLKIEEMSDNHLLNAINSLIGKQNHRALLISNLISDGNIIDNIQNSYENNRDILSIKIRELERELNYRKD